MSMSKLKSDLRLKTPFRCNLSSCSPLGHVTEPPPEIAIVLPDQKNAIAFGPHAFAQRSFPALLFFYLSFVWPVSVMWRGRFHLWSWRWRVVVLALMWEALGLGPGTDVAGTRARSWH